MVEVREFDAALQQGAGEGARNQIDRRLRDLYVYFEITKVYPEHRRRVPGYRLDGWRTQPRTSKNVRVSSRVRVQVLSKARCAYCGKTPLGDDIKLDVDHILPQAWGGTNDPENLQPLCTQCNHDKKDWFSTFEKYAEQIRAATKSKEPHKRIGELLKAFEGEPVPGDLIGVVASMGSFQEDWQKRLRELRTIGWDIKNKKIRVSVGRRRVLSHYYVVTSQPWPKGPVIAAVRAQEKLNKAAKAAKAE